MKIINLRLSKQIIFFIKPGSFLDICDINGARKNSSLGILTSPNYPSSYPVNEDCGITLSSPDGTSFIIKLESLQVGTRT